MDLLYVQYSSRPGSQKRELCFVPWENLKIACMLGSCDMRNTLLASDYWWVENACKLLLTSWKYLQVTPVVHFCTCELITEVNPVVHVIYAHE